MNKIIQNLLKKYETNNPIDIAKQLGIIVLYENLGTINGYYNTAFRMKFIHINECLPDHKIKFVVAHELGHALLHPKVNTPFMRNCTYFCVNKYEIEANMFAVNLLISNDMLDECKGFNVEQIAMYFGIHPEMIKLRLKCS